MINGEKLFGVALLEIFVIITMYIVVYYNFSHDKKIISPNTTPHSLAMQPMTRDDFDGKEKCYNFCWHRQGTTVDISKERVETKLGKPV